MNTKLLVVLATAACSSPASRKHSLGDAEQLKSHLESRGCVGAPPIGNYQYWFTCVQRLMPCGCYLRVTVRASDPDGSSRFLVDGVDADVRGCAEGVGFAEVDDLLDPLFPLQYRGAIHAFIRIRGQPTTGTATSDYGVIQFAEFPGVSLSAMQRLDPNRPGLVVSVNHNEGYAPAKFISAPRMREGCQK